MTQHPDPSGRPASPWGQDTPVQQDVAAQQDATARQDPWTAPPASTGGGSRRGGPAGGGRSRLPWILVAALLLVVGIGAALLLGGNDGQTRTFRTQAAEPPAGSATPPASPTSAASATSAPPSASASTSTASTATAASVQPSATSAAPRPPAQLPLPSGGRQCSDTGQRDVLFPRSAAANDVTTCEFAKQVRDAYLASGADGTRVSVEAYSPATGRTYRMTCSGGSVVSCAGGNNARVLLF